MITLRRNRFGSIKKLRNANTMDYDGKRHSVFIGKSTEMVRKNSKNKLHPMQRPQSGLSRQDVKYNENLEMERFA